MKKGSPEGGDPPKNAGHPQKSVDEYLAAVPEPARGTLEKLRTMIRSAAPPGATETISYGIPAFKYKGILVWYAAFSNHCSLFPTAAIIAAFRNELEEFETSKGTIRFPLDRPPPEDLVRTLVKARVVHNESRKTNRT